MTYKDLVNAIRLKSSFLCVGLDPDLERIPSHLGNGQNAVLEFCQRIIESTREYCVAYKLNIAFFEALGQMGWETLHEVVRSLPKDCFLIADAKRADIGNSSIMYARAFFEHLNFDAITVAPYMGSDSVLPFLEYEDKWTILLGLTSNPGSADFQMMTDSDGVPLYERVLSHASSWGSPDQLMFVIGATHPDLLKRIRGIVPEHFFLVPGVGTQGGTVAEVASHGMNGDCGLIINATRSIIYVSSAEDFAERAGDVARNYQLEMREHLHRITGNE